jgi:hypothetical protein
MRKRHNGIPPMSASVGLPKAAGSPTSDEQIAPGKNRPSSKNLKFRNLIADYSTHVLQLDKLQL